MIPRNSVLNPLARVAIVAAVTLGLSAAPVWAQADTSAGADPATVAALLKQVTAMEAEIKTLKTQLDQVQEKQASAPAASDAAASADAAPTYPNLNFHGFGDFQYQYASNHSQFPNLFSVGEIDFYVTSQISENASILSENVLSADPTFNNWNLEAERLIFDYKVSPYLNLVGGRFHTQMGYYNTAFHHGTWFELDTHRPWFLEFEDSGGILPVHMVGVSADGAVPSGSLNLHYYVQVGNGRSYSPPTSPANPTQADEVAEGHKAVNLAFTAKPTWAPGVELGGGLYHQVITPQDVVAGLGAAGTDVNLVNQTDAAETIANLFAVYNANGWNFLNEGFLITHKPTGDTSHHTVAGYTEVGKKFGEWTPYARYTYVNSPASDPVYNLIQTTGLRYGPTAGLRFDFTDYACLKLQYDHNTLKNEQEATPIDNVTFQVGFTF